MPRGNMARALREMHSNSFTHVECRNRPDENDDHAELSSSKNKAWIHPNTIMFQAEY